MTTVLLNLHNAGFYGFDSMVIAMGIAYGGLAQIAAGIMEYKKGNTFGMVAFSSYGLFWWSLIILKVFPYCGLFNPYWVYSLKPSTEAMAAYFFMWGFFTFAMFFGTLKTNRTLQFVFLSLTVLFWLLTANELTGIAELGTILGYEGIICGASAMYLALAEIINEANGKAILPIFPVES